MTMDCLGYQPHFATASFKQVDCRPRWLQVHPLMPTWRLFWAAAARDELSA
jgi:hypothetical protein